MNYQISLNEGKKNKNKKLKKIKQKDGPKRKNQSNTFEWMIS